MPTCVRLLCSRCDWSLLSKLQSHREKSKRTHVGIFYVCGKRLLHQAQVRARMQDPTSKLYMPAYFPNATKPPPNPKPSLPKPKPGKASPKKKSRKNPKRGTDDSPAKSSSSADSDTTL